MWPDRVSNPGPPTYESGALPIALRGPAFKMATACITQVRAFIMVDAAFHLVSVIRYFAIAFKKIMKNKDYDIN